VSASRAEIELPHGRLPAGLPRGQVDLAGFVGKLDSGAQDPAPCSAAPGPSTRSGMADLAAIDFLPLRQRAAVRRHALANLTL
jgi:hypothetical protein